MPDGPKGQFQCGDFWLDQEPGRSTYYIYWYDRSKRRVKRKATGTSDFNAAIRAITNHQLAAIGPTTKEKDNAPTLRQILMKYWLDHGQKTINSDGAQRHLRMFLNFIDHCEDTGIFPEDPTLDHWKPGTIPDYIKYIQSNPSYHERKVYDPDDETKVVEVIRTPRQRSNDSINRMMDDVRAAFNYAADCHMTKWAPKFKHLPKARDELEARKPRLSMDQMADMFVYAFSSDDRQHLQAYLVAAVSTLARPTEILAISTDPAREQIDITNRLLFLNPKGRTQTKKYRPVVPINDLFLSWLVSCDGRRKSGGSPYLVNFRSKPLSSIRQPWNKAKAALGWPMVREWDAKMIRHTVSTWLRANKDTFRIDKDDIKLQLGHHRPDVTDIYAIYEPNYLDNIQVGLRTYISEIEALVKKRRSHVALTPKGVEIISTQNNQVKPRS